MFEDSSSWHGPAAHPQELTMPLAEFKFLHMQESIQKIIIATRSTGVHMFVTRGFSNTVIYIYIFPTHTYIYIYIYIFIPYSHQSSVVISSHQSSAIWQRESILGEAYHPLAGENPFLARHIIHLAERIRSWRGISSIWEHKKNAKLVQNQVYIKYIGKSSSRKLRWVIYYTLYIMDPQTYKQICCCTTI